MQMGWLPPAEDPFKKAMMSLLTLSLGLMLFLAASTGQDSVSYVTFDSSVPGRAMTACLGPTLLSSWLNLKPSFTRDLEFH